MGGRCKNCFKSLGPAVVVSGPGFDALMRRVIAGRSGWRTLGALALSSHSWQACDAMGFEIIGPMRSVVTIAIGGSIRDLPRLRRMCGRGRWRKRKGIVTVRLADGFIAEAELHRYDATGVGKREMRIKRLVG